MKSSLPKIEPQYIVDETGKKTGVILDIKTFEKFLEEVEDVYLGTQAKATLDSNQEYVTHDEVKRKLSKK